MPSDQDFSEDSGNPIPQPGESDYNKLSNWLSKAQGNADSKCEGS